MSSLLSWATVPINSFNGLIFWQCCMILDINPIFYVSKKISFNILVWQKMLPLTNFSKCNTNMSKDNLFYSIIHQWVKADQELEISLSSAKQKLTTISINCCWLVNIFKCVCLPLWNQFLFYFLTSLCNINIKKWV